MFFLGSFWSITSGGEAPLPADRPLGLIRIIPVSVPKRKRKQKIGKIAAEFKEELQILQKGDPILAKALLKGIVADVRKINKLMLVLDGIRKSEVRKKSNKRRKSIEAFLLLSMI